MRSLSLRYSFGPFELLPEGGELWKSGLQLKLAPQPFQLLMLLVEKSGTLVTRDELRAALWTDGTVVEFDQGLNYCIRQIRLVLGDDARDPVYIETVPKRGYRFIAPVVVQNPEEIVEPVAAEPPPPVAPPPQPPPPPSRRPWILWSGLAAAVLFGIALWPKGPNLPRDPRARVLFLEAEHLAETWETPRELEAVEKYRQVTEIEPGFALAWAGLTNVEIMLAPNQPSPVKALADAEAHAREALRLDDSLASAHAALGHCYWQQWKWGEADQEFRKALKAAGDTATSHQLHGLYLASVGRKQEAVNEARRAVEMAPTSGLMNYSLAQVYLQTGDFEQALAQANKTLQMDRHYPSAFQTLLRANIQLGRLAEAERALDDEMRFFEDKSLAPWRAYLLARMGRVQQARELFQAEAYRNRKNPHASLGHAAALLAMDGPDAALAALADSVDAHVGSMQWIWTAPEMAPLRMDARFREIASKTGKVLR